MAASNRSIFRENALQQHRHEREEAVFPRLVSPRTFFALWLILGLLLAAGLIVWAARVPVFASGSAVILGSVDQAQTGEVAAAVLLPPELLPALDTSQPIFVEFAEGVRLQRSITSIEPTVRSPEKVREQLGLSRELGATVTQPFAIAFADLAPLPSDLPDSMYAGSVYRAEIEIGSRRVIVLLPFIGPFFEGW